MMKFRILHHDRCFDGACSAALFTKFHRECVGAARDGYEYCGLAHRPGGGFQEEALGDGKNAVVDFKYTRSPKLTWWFDHHESAFPLAGDREAFEAGQLGEKRGREFFNADAVSCSGWIAEVGRTRFGWDTRGLEELLAWADVIDGARFESAEQAVMLREPALQVMMAIENAEDGFIPRVIPLLTEVSLGEIVAEPFVQAALGPLMSRHRAAMEVIRDRVELREGVNFFDVTDLALEGVSKFIPYYYHPEAVYTVGLSRGMERAKVSVGTNPWTRRDADTLVNIAEVCGRFGGGGHARVGAISYKAEEVERARAVGREIAEELRAGERSHEQQATGAGWADSD